MAEKVSRFLWFQVNWIREKKELIDSWLFSHIYGCHVVMGYHVGRDIDKSIQFRTKSGGLTIKKKFQLKKLKLFSSNSFLEQKMKSKKFKNSRESEKEKLMMEKNVSSKQKKNSNFEESTSVSFFNIKNDARTQNLSAWARRCPTTHAPTRFN